MKSVLLVCLLVAGLGVFYWGARRVERRVYHYRRRKYLRELTAMSQAFDLDALPPAPHCVTEDP